MAINVRTHILQQTQNIPSVGVVGVVLDVLTASSVDEYEGKIIKINNLSQLEEHFKFSTYSEDELALKELAIMEYLLIHRVPIIAVLKEAKAIDERIALLEGEEVDFIITPGVEYTPGFDVDSKLLAIDGDLKLVGGILKELNVQYIFDLKELEDVAFTTLITNLKTAVGRKSVIELNRLSEVAYGAFESVINSKYANRTDKTLPASVPLVVGKALNLIRGTPWIPMAGEENGLVPSVIKTTRRLSKEDKNALQAAGVNVLGFKRGVGHFFTTQNTLVAGRAANPDHPYTRSHVVSLALWIEKSLYNNFGKYMFRPNNSKTWTLLDMDLTKVFRRLLDLEAIENYNVYTGLQVMTQQDINDGKLVAAVRYKPVRVVESIELNLYITEEDFEITEELNYGGNE